MSDNNNTLSPLISEGNPVNWWFAFKFNEASFPKCDRGDETEGIFGGTVKDYHGRYSQQYVFASAADPTLQKGKGCIGMTLEDPVGATFNQIYNGSCYYVVWNDQFYDDPPIHGCDKSCGAPWGHSKGVIAWNDDGEGLVMQVSTPSWPASGSKDYPRKTDGNTLGTIKDDDIEVSQHFFSLKLTKDDVVMVLKAMSNASVVTDITNKQVVQSGGPQQIQDLVAKLGVQSHSTECVKFTLSSGVELIGKPSMMHVPPWQLVSAQLNSLPVRVACWWAHPKIYSTTADSKLTCWDDSLGKPGAVEIATSGMWDGVELGLEGGEGEHFNHGKFAVSLDSSKPYTIFGDMNQQGAMYPGYSYENQACSSSQNGRGGLFYRVENEALWQSVSALIKGGTAPTDPKS